MGLPAFYIPRSLPDELFSLLDAAGVRVARSSIPMSTPGVFEFGLKCTSDDGRVVVGIEFSQVDEHRACCCITGGPGLFNGKSYRDLVNRIEEVLRLHGGVEVGEVSD